MNAHAPISILLAGVGGQGVLTAASVIADAAHHAGLAVHAGQLHGMSQRSGSVESSVILGAAATSFIAPAGADIVLGFEPLETLRALPQASHRAQVVMNTARLAPSAFALAGCMYPPVAEIADRIGRAVGTLDLLDAAALAATAGAPRALNMAMLGALAELPAWPLGAEPLRAAIGRQFPNQAANLAAFELGRNVIHLEKAHELADWD